MNYTYKKVDIFEPSTNIKYADLIKDTKLLKYTKRIFGECVTNAFVLCKSDRNKICYSNLGKNESISINYGNVDIILEFNNTNLVKFDNSEWATLTKLELQLL